MSYSGETADQVVRMSLHGVEVAARISGAAAERLARLIYAVLRDQKKTRGKTRLTSMLKSGKALRVLAVEDAELKDFCQEAKKYGVLFCVLKDRVANDGHTDVIIREEDAGKVGRIFERFGFSRVDVGQVVGEILESREKRDRIWGDPVREEEPPEGETWEKPDPLAWLEEVMADLEKEPEETSDPVPARPGASRPSGPFSEPTRDRRSPSGDGAERRPSVRQKLRDLREKVKEAEPLDAGRIAETLGKTGGKDR